VTFTEVCVQSAENEIGTASGNINCKETSDDEGAEAVLNSEVVSLEKRDFDEDAEEDN
jgi:hypothetical protein